VSTSKESSPPRKETAHRVPLPSDPVLYNQEVANEIALLRIPPEVVRVLDVGCGAGANGRWLREHGFRAIGLTCSIEEGLLARQSYDAIVIGDAERFFPCGTRPTNAILFIDCLEHLRDPWRVLEQCRQSLSDDGCVVAFIPNVAHLTARLALARGSFRYTTTGLMDRTHLRFFDRATVQDLFEASGYRIDSFEDIWVRPAKGLLEAVVGRARSFLLGRWPALFARHFLIVARPVKKAEAA
jgi:SAM-dependent methyltransferase